MESKPLLAVAEQKPHVTFLCAAARETQMHTTNYRDTLITVSPDCPVTVATPPMKPETIAGREHAILNAAPYSMTSDELLLAIENERKGPISGVEFFSKPRACLRASPLVKKHGFGLHHDAEGKIALVPMESEEYARLLAATAVEKRPGMRSSRR